MGLLGDDPPAGIPRGLSFIIKLRRIFIADEFEPHLLVDGLKDRLMAAVVTNPFSVEGPRVGLPTSLPPGLPLFFQTAPAAAIGDDDGRFFVILLQVKFGKMGPEALAISLNFVLVAHLGHGNCTLLVDIHESSAQGFLNGLFPQPLIDKAQQGQGPVPLTIMQGPVLLHQFSHVSNSLLFLASFYRLNGFLFWAYL